MAFIHADFSPLSNIFVRLRILHPIVAVALGIVLVLACKLCAFAKRLSIAVAALVFAQFTLGIANIVLLTPIWLQLTHLLTVDLLWIACVLLADLQPASASPAPPRTPKLTSTPTLGRAASSSMASSVTSMEGHALSVG